MEEQKNPDLHLILGSGDYVWGLTTDQIRQLIERDLDRRWRKPGEEQPPYGTDVLVLTREHWFPHWAVRQADGWHMDYGTATACYWMPMTALPDLPEEPNDD